MRALRFGLLLAALLWALGFTAYITLPPLLAPAIASILGASP